ncbi:hypothetical protein BH10BDE1_BH10BDE1_07990 [soil metagenome]
MKTAPGNPKPKVSRKLIDIVLISTILASAVFILFRVFRHPEAEESTQTAVPTRRAPEISLPKNAANLPVVTDAEWAAVVSDPALRAARTKRSDGCAESFNHRRWGFWTANPDRIAQIKRGQPQTLWGLKDFPCFEVGQKLRILTFDKTGNAPVVTYLTTMNVTDIISIDIGKIPASYYKAQDTTAEAFATFLAFKRPAGLRGHDTIVRLGSPLVETLPADEAPAEAENARIISKSDLPALHMKYPKLVVIDVRSPTEFAEGNIPTSINIPFTPAPYASTAFNWKVLTSDLAQSRFDLATVFAIPPGQAVAIVGGPPKDGRAFWALRAIGTTRGNLFYLHDGVK